MTYDFPVPNHLKDWQQPVVCVGAMVAGCVLVFFHCRRRGRRRTAMDTVGDDVDDEDPDREEHGQDSVNCCACVTGLASDGNDGVEDHTEQDITTYLVSVGTAVTDPSTAEDVSCCVHDELWGDLSLEKAPQICARRWFCASTVFDRTKRSGHQAHSAANCSSLCGAKVEHTRLVP